MESKLSNLTLKDDEHENKFKNMKECDDEEDYDDDDDEENEVIDETQDELKYHPITNPLISFTNILDSFNYDKNQNNFNLLSYLDISTTTTTNDSDDDDDDDIYEKLIVIINKCRKAVHEQKDINYYIHNTNEEVDNNDLNFYKPILDDDAYIQSLDDIIDIYYKEQREKKQDNNELKVIKNDESIEVLKERINSLQDQLVLAKQYVQKLSLDDDNETKNDNEKKNNKYIDKNYFSSYSHTNIHAEMLLDTIRTKAYQNAIMSTDFKDKVVLDVGCGTGILSLFALSNNAKKVYAIDNSDILPTITSKIFEENGYNTTDGDKIQLIHGKMEDITTDVIKEPVDIIISEWMGYALLFESMLPSVLYARDTFLKPTTGKLYPNDCKMYIEGANSSSSISYWENVYGYKMNPMKQLLLNERRKEAYVETIPSDSICTNKYTILSLDLYKCSIKDLDYIKIEKFELVGDGIMHKLIISFDVIFPSDDDDDDSGGVILSTTCQQPETHWKQTSIWLTNDEYGIELNNDNKLIGTFEMKKGSINHRELEFTVYWELVSCGSKDASDTVLKNGCINSKLSC